MSWTVGSPTVTGWKRRSSAASFSMYLRVLVERRRADAAQFPAREHRLEQVGGVDRALGGARADDRVQLVEEQDDRALRLGDLFEHALQAFLELAAVGGAGDQRAHVQRDHAPVAQRLGHVVRDDPLGEALDDRGLADARLADQHGVVLGAAGEHLDHAADLLVAPDHRVELALLGHLGEVAPEALQRALLLLGLAGAADRVSRRAVRSHCCCASSVRLGPNVERTSAARTMSVPPPRYGTSSARKERRTSSRRCGQLDLRAQRLHLELLDAGVHVVDLGLEVEHALDAGEVEAEVGRHLLDAPQPLDVLLGVQARALGRALGLDQPARLVRAQRLRVHVRELGGDRDHEHAAVGLDLDAGGGPAGGERSSDAPECARTHARA